MRISFAGDITRLRANRMQLQGFNAALNCTRPSTVN
jgi:hypothetical protein